MMRFGLRRPRASISAAALVIAAASAAFAQPASDRVRPVTTPDPTRGTSLGAHLSPVVAQRLLRSPDVEEQIRGVRRLGSQNDYGAVQVLLQLFDDTPGLSANPRLRLEAVRTLSPFASRDSVRLLLLSWATDNSTRGATAGPLGNLAREQAAMALAATSNVRAVEQLVLTVIDGGPAGHRAARALIAHPPRDLRPLLYKQALESPDVVEILGELGDLRAIPKLRSLLKVGDLGVKVAAAVALARLGDGSGVKSARDWITQEGSTHSLRVGAARTLTLSRDSYAPKAIAVLLADPATRGEGLSLAVEAPTPQLAPTLAGLLSIVKGPDRTRVLAALARAGGSLAIRTLAALVRKSPVDVDAAYALAHCRDPNAAALISGLIASETTRRTGVRAALVRAIEIGQQVDGLQDVLETMAKSQDPADRSVGVFGRVVIGDASVEDYTSSKDAVQVLAACRAALAKPEKARESCSLPLTSHSDPVMRDGLGGALMRSSSLPGASTNTLLEWAESSRVSAPVFGRALGPRDNDAYRTRIERLLASGDPAMRSQVAIGLGQSPEASTAARLAEAYAFEADPWVRRAVVLGLAARQSAVGRPWLQMAARLDPDEQVRALARHAIAGRRLLEPTQGNQVLWLRLAGTNPSETTGHLPVRVMMSNSYATVVVTAPDGQVLVPGLTPGNVIIRVGNAQEPSKI